MKNRVLIIAISFILTVFVIEKSIQAKLFKLYCSPTSVEKLVVTNDNCILYSSVEESAGTPVPLLSILWRLDVSGSADGLKHFNGKSYYHVGSAAGEEWGWIEKNDDAPFVTKWDTNFLYKLSGSTSAHHFEIFNDKLLKESLLKFPEGSLTPYNAYAFILKTEADFNLNSVQHVFVYTSQNNGKPAEVKPDASNLTTEIVFVIDTTSGTESVIDMLKQLSRKLIDFLVEHPEYKDCVRFGLVEFRDEIAGDPGNKEGFLSRIVQPLSDNHSDFLRKVNGLKPCPVDNGDIPEQVGCGLMTAINDINWSKDSVKHIFLLGDAPNKQKSVIPEYNGLIDGKDYSLKNRCRITDSNGKEIEGDIASIIARGRSVKEKQFNFHAIGYTGNYELSDPHCEEMYSQFSLLAQNSGEYQGLFGVYINKKKSVRISDQLSEKIIDCIKLLRQARDSEPEDEEDEDDVPTVWKLTKATEPSIHSGVIYGFARAQDSDGVCVAIPCVLILREDIENFRDNMVVFRKTLSRYLNGVGSLNNLFNEFQERYGDDAEEGEGITENTDLESLLGTGFPYKTDILKTTLGDLSQMTKDEFKNWVVKLGRTISSAEAMLNNKDNWTAQGWQPPQGKPQEFQLVPIEDLL